MTQRYGKHFNEYVGMDIVERKDGAYVKYTDYQELETDNKKLREQLDAANYVIQTLNRVIAGDVE